MNTHYDQDLKPLNQAEIRDMVGSNAYYGGSLDMESGHIHPLKFCLGLATLATKAGAQIFENARVVKLDEPTTNTTKNHHHPHPKRPYKSRPCYHRVQRLSGRLTTRGRTARDARQ